jgi:regulator of replication initiation timing
MTKKEEQQMQELKEANQKLLAENIDLKIQIEKMKSRVQALECVAKLIEGSRSK